MVPASIWTVNHPEKNLRMRYITLSGLLLLTISASACGRHAVGEPGADAATPTPDSQVQPPTPDSQVQPPGDHGLAFLRGQQSSIQGALYTIQPDGTGLVPLNAGLDPEGGVERYQLSELGGVIREGHGFAGERTMRYHVLRADRSVILSTPFEPWALHEAELGVTPDGQQAWLFSQGQLLRVDLTTETQDSWQVVRLFSVDPSARWAMVSDSLDPETMLSQLDLTTGTTTSQALFNTMQQPFASWIFDELEATAYVQVGTQDYWALPTDEGSAHSLADQWGAPGLLQGQCAATGELILQATLPTSDEIFALDPASGTIRFRQPFDGFEQRHGLSPEGAWYASVRFTDDEDNPASAIHLLDTRTDTLRAVDISDYLEKPYSCCCGGVKVGPLVFGAELLAVPLLYSFGECACACMDPDVIQPDEATLQILLVDLATGTLSDVLFHNGICPPSFSPDSTRLAICDNDLHLVPLAGGYLQSGIATYTLSTGETTRLTDPAEFDSAVSWIR